MDEPKKSKDAPTQNRLERAIYKICGAIEKAATSALRGHPKVRSMGSEYERLKEYSDETAARNRKKYPERFARADAHIRDLTGQRDGE